MDAKALNTFLENAAFLAGPEPTTKDAEQFATMKECPELPHAARWYRNIASYSEEERKAFPAPVEKKEEKKEEKKKEEEDEDEDFDVFETTEDDEKALEAERIRKADEAAAKAKAAGHDRSQIILSVKPWDDTTPLKEMEKKVREIEMEGLLWGTSKLVPVAFGIKNLQIMVIVDDVLVSVDELEERITAIEDYVQSVDIVSFNKL